MKRKSAKEKGKKAEKEVGEILGIWWQNQPFVRSHGSGSATTESQSGDIIIPLDFPWAIESKNVGVTKKNKTSKGREWTMDSILKGGCKLFIDWWEQACKQADSINKKPMLCFTRNYVPTYVAIYKNIVYDDVDDTVSFINLWGYGNNTIVIFKLSDFVTVFKKEDFVGYH